MSEEKTCSICSEEPNEDKWIKLKDCRHEFHMDCIGKWHEQCLERDRRSKCPICRRYTNIIGLQY